MKTDIWDNEFREICINPKKLIEQAKRYRMDVRFALGLVKTEEQFNRDKDRVTRILRQKRDDEK